MNRAPPTPEVPEPTTTLTEPPAPLAAVPDAITIAPVPADDAVPVLSVSEPDEPAAVASADEIVTAPVPPLTEPPLTTLTAPPILPLASACPA